MTNHQHALDTMRNLGDHRVSLVAVSEPAAHRGSSRARARPGPAPARRGATAWHDGDGPVHVPAPAPAPASRSDSRRHQAKKQVAPSERAAKAKPRRRPAMVFVDDGAEDEAGKNPTTAVRATPVSAVPSPSSARLSGRPHYRSPWAERRAPGGAAHPRRHAIVAAGVSAVALAVVVAVTIPSSTPTGGHHRSGSSHGAVTPLRRALAPGSVTGATPSTAPSPADISPTTSSAHSAGYTLSGGGSGYTLAIAATGLCWVMATAQPTGALVWTGTLGAGQSRSLPVSSSVQVQLGAASDVTVSMNGRPVALPPGYQSPFDMNFEVSA